MIDLKKLAEKLLPDFMLNITKSIYHFFLSQRNNVLFKDRICRDLLICQQVPKLLAAQTKKQKFNRYDIIVRYLAIEEYYDKNNYGFRLYEKMQSKRIGFVNHNNRLIELIENINKFSYNYQSLIFIDSRNHLIDGSHRFALSLYFKKDLITLKVSKFVRNISYDMNWFIKNNFSEKDLELIQRKKDEIFYEEGIYFPVIVWPSLQNYFRIFEKEISDEFRIYKSIILNLEDEFNQFVREIYSIDDIAEWKINKKIEGLKEYTGKIKILWIEVINPNFRRKTSTSNDISKNMETFKTKLRKKYSNKVKNYFYDITIHTGDNYWQNKAINKIINKYLKSCVSELFF